MLRTVFVIVFGLAGPIMLTACTDFPQLEGKISATARNADFPELVPMDQLVTPTQTIQITPESIATLQGRVARLRARAARLQRPVVDAATRARLQAALLRHR